jgi:hypothetical protein
MTEWEYLWRETYWAETGRSEGYVHWVSYEHVWKPDRQAAEHFPDDHGLDALGKAGWELVALTPHSVSLLSRVSPQGDSYSDFTVYLLMFKRPLPASL